MMNASFQTYLKHLTAYEKDSSIQTEDSVQSGSGSGDGGGSSNTMPTH